MAIIAPPTTAAKASNVAPTNGRTSYATPRTDFAESNEDAAAACNQGEFAEAKQLWLPLAERGDAPAQVGLAMMYFLGQGVQRNMATALKWWHKAADQGLASAQYELGQFYEHP
jgi:TPR repeat protein